MAKQTVGTTYADLKAQMGRKDFQPVYFLCGEENYFIDRLCEILESILEDDQKDFDEAILYGKDVTMSRVIDEARMFPMTGPYRVVIIKEAQNLNDYDLLIPYLKNPNKTTILAFCYKNKKPDGRVKAFAEIKKNAVYFESEKYYDNQIPAWIKNYATKGKGLTIDDKSAIILANHLGNDLTKISNEINKLSIITKTITPDVIEENIGISKNYNSFELQNSIANHDVLLANKIVQYFSDNPKDFSIQATLSVLFDFFSNLMILHYAKLTDKRAIAAEIGINPFFADAYIRAMSFYNAMKTFKILHAIRETDARSKGFGNNSTENGDLLKELIFIILH